MTSLEEFEAFWKARFPCGCPSETDAAGPAFEAWRAARVGMVKKEELDKYVQFNENNCRDWAEDHTHLQKLCMEAGIPEDQVHGDRMGVPDISDLADMLAKKAMEAAQ